MLILQNVAMQGYICEKNNTINANVVLKHDSTRTTWTLE